MNKYVLPDWYRHILDVSTPLSREEETQLIIAAKEGDKEARDKVISSNFRLIIVVIKSRNFTRFISSSLSYEDLLQAGCEGMIVAFDRFDLSKGYRYPTYAVWWIRQRIQKLGEERSRTIRLPLNRVSQLNEVIRQIYSFCRQEHRRPSLDELSVLLPEIPVDTISHLLDTNFTALSLDAPLHDPSSDNLYGLIPSFVNVTDELTVSGDRAVLIESLLSCLTQREKAMVKMRYGVDEGSEPATYREIGEEFGVTRQRATQIIERAIIKARRALSP